MKENIIECPINAVLKMVFGLKITALLHICLLAPWLAEREDEEGGREGSVLWLKIWPYCSTSKSSVNTGVTLHSLKMHDLFKHPSVI